MKIQTSPSSSLMQRKARARSLIQLGGLLEHAETLQVFNIPLGIDLQSDPSVKNNIAALFKALLIMNEMVKSQELDLEVLALQGLQAFKDKGLSESRPLDRKKEHKVEAYSEDLSSEEFVPHEVANQNTNQNKLQKSENL